MAETDIVIGYSAFELFEECYEYDESACRVSDSPESLKNYLKNALLPLKDYRLEAVKFSDFLNDFGYSRGEYALEPQALARFEQAAKAYGLQYGVEEYKPDAFHELEPRVFFVKFSGWKRSLE